MVITGSANWTGAGMEDNYESVMIIHSRELARQVSQEWHELATAPGHVAVPGCNPSLVGFDAAPWPMHFGLVSHRQLVPIP